jgi:hypothetical protein
VSKFSDFINNATPEEKQAVFDSVMHNANLAQQNFLFRDALVKIKNHASFEHGDDLGVIGGILISIEEICDKLIKNNLSEKEQ